MTPDGITTPPAVVELLQRYMRNRSAYESGTYNEAQLRGEFLDPLFEALGWDIRNTAGYAEPYKDVVVESRLLVGGASKAPDYSFRVGGNRRFFVEAKKPALNVRAGQEAAYQLRRYGWSAKLPLSVLTNFWELAVYDCRQEPRMTDEASVARILYMTAEELVEQWGRFAEIFSREAVLKGLFDTFTDATKAKRGTAEVDDAFLGEMKRWRDQLARTLALRNPGLTDFELNYCVQQIIDRIVFLRICEDRGIEPYGRLRDILPHGDVYERLLDLFARADGRYNSGLFHFKEEAGWIEAPDTLTPRLHVDDKTLRDVISRLYYPESPYEFSVLPSDILGHVYEQFLGQVIRLTAGHRAVVEDKPEVRRAGGVYYTPTFVVEHIVEHTVGRELEGASLRKAGNLRILDPACGSGSFLLVAYQYLLDWHLQRYLEDPKRNRARLRPSPNGDLRLTTKERKRILLSSIFGVDIDPQAVEVTKLSLLLKVLEGESDATIAEQLALFHERALPDLAGNIRCGNSLVGPDVYDNAQLVLLPSEEVRMNAFSWQDEFSTIMTRGGFDVVLGNPPYVYRNATENALRDYYVAHYSSVQGNFELYKFFVERAIQLIRPNGRLGYILSAGFLVLPTFSRLRKLIVETVRIEGLAPLGPGVFQAATVDTCILVVKNGTAPADHEVLVRAPSKPKDLPTTEPYRIRQARFAGNEDQVFDYRLSEAEADLYQRLVQAFPRLDVRFEVGVGINTGYIRKDITAPRQVDKRYHRMVLGSGIGRYEPVRTQGWILYDPEYVRSRGDRGRTLPAERLLSGPKVLVVRTRNLAIEQRIVATLDRSGAYNLNRLSNIISRDGASLEGLLGVLNSQVFQWFFSKRYFDYEIKPVYLKACPIPDCNDGRLIKLVEKALAAATEVAVARTSPERVGARRRLRGLEVQINQRVSELYGLDSAELKLLSGQSVSETIENQPHDAIAEPSRQKAAGTPEP